MHGGWRAMRSMDIRRSGLECVNEWKLLMHGNRGHHMHRTLSTRVYLQISHMMKRLMQADIDI